MANQSWETDFDQRYDNDCIHLTRDGISELREFIAFEIKAAEKRGLEKTLEVIPDRPVYDKDNTWNDEQDQGWYRAIKQVRAAIKAEIEKL